MTNRWALTALSEAPLITSGEAVGIIGAVGT